MSNPSCAFECSPPPPYVIPIDETVQRINARSLKSNELKMEWIPITKGHISTYIAVAVTTLIYNGICCVHNFGRTPWFKQNAFDDIFGEEALLYSVCLQWVLISVIFVTGIVVERSIPQPMHIFLSILATNGSAVLFVINVRKVRDGVIPIDSLYFIFVTLTCVLAVILCIAYLVALRCYREQKRYYHYLTLSATKSRLLSRLNHSQHDESCRSYQSYPQGTEKPLFLSPIRA